MRLFLPEDFQTLTQTPEASPLELTQTSFRRQVAAMLMISSCLLKNFSQAKDPFQTEQLLTLLPQQTAVVTNFVRRCWQLIPKVRLSLSRTFCLSNLSLGILWAREKRLFPLPNQLLAKDLLSPQEVRHKWQLFHPTATASLMRISSQTTMSKTKTSSFLATTIKVPKILPFNSRL